MIQKRIDTDLFWWGPLPKDTHYILLDCGFPKQSLPNYKSAFQDIMLTYSTIRKGNGYMMESTLVKQLRPLTTRMDVHRKVIECKWLFRRTRWEGKKEDYVLQPIFDSYSLDKNNCRAILDAIKEQDYETLLQLVPPVKRKIPKMAGDLFPKKTATTDNDASHHEPQSDHHSEQHSDTSNAHVIINRDRNKDRDNSSYLPVRN